VVIANQEGIRMNLMPITERIVKRSFPLLAGRATVNYPRQPGKLLVPLRGFIRQPDRPDFVYRSLRNFHSILLSTCTLGGGSSHIEHNSMLSHHQRCRGVMSFLFVAHMFQFLGCPMDSMNPMPHFLQVPCLI
jgi:hypothetical protein